MPIVQNGCANDSLVSHRYISHVAKIKPQTVVVYKRFYGFSSSKSEAELKNLEKGKKGEYNGFMSPATARKVRTLLENWLLTLEQSITNDWQTDIRSALADKTLRHERYPTFITLTLPAQQAHDDNFIKRNLLNRFLIQLKNAHDVVHYFWRSEPQKNRNIHFHILCDKWIHWKSIRYEWNRILNDHGYIDAYRQNQQARHANGFNPDIRQMREQLSRLREYHTDKTAYFDETNIRTHQPIPFDLKSEQKRVLQRMRMAWEEGGLICGIVHNSSFGG